MLVVASFLTLGGAAFIRLSRSEAEAHRAASVQRRETAIHEESGLGALRERNSVGSTDHGTEPSVRSDWKSYLEQFRREGEIVSRGATVTRGTSRIPTARSTR